jgi:peptidyl-prolyl cis-trans isomerase SurA
MMIKRNTLNLLIISLCFAQSPTVWAINPDRIVAIVEEDVILESELQHEVNTIVQRLQSTKAQLPPEQILRKQLLEKIIIDKLQKQLAERAGISVSEETLNNSAAEIAERNKLTVDQFRAELEKQGMSYKNFLDTIRDEIVINQLRGREIGGRIKVSDQEVDHALETQSNVGDESIQYHLGHILIAVKEGASSDTWQAAQRQADKIVVQLRGGGDFTQIAMAQSNDSNALKGGDLGWRTLSTLPTLFADSVTHMKQGDISASLRSPSGFHIIKMLDIKGLNDHIVIKTKVRHILLKNNELLDDAEAKKRLFGLKARLLNGEDFASLARTHSDDKSSALKGGSLDWVNSGDLVKPFEDAMAHLKINQISDPIQTQFGWHLIQVLGRENQDNSADYRKNRVRDALRKRKIDEETELWLRRLRDEAYVEINPARL